MNVWGCRPPIRKWQTEAGERGWLDESEDTAL